MPSETLRTGAAARELGIHPDTLREWARLGAVAYQRTPGGRMYFRRSDLEALRESMEHPAEGA